MSKYTYDKGDEKLIHCPSCRGLILKDPKFENKNSSFKILCPHCKEQSEVIIDQGRVTIIKNEINLANAKKIILIEDDRYLCRAYKDGLERAGFRLILAYDGKEGLEKIKTEKPDLVLLDLVMPVLDGFKVLKELKNDDNTRHLPIVVLTNLGQDEDIKKGMDLGAVDYLIKTEYSMREVIEKVKKYLMKPANGKNPIS